MVHSVTNCISTKKNIAEELISCKKLLKMLALDIGKKEDGRDFKKVQ